MKQLIALSCLVVLLVACKDGDLAKKRQSLQETLDEIALFAEPRLANLETIKKTLAELPKATDIGSISITMSPLIRKFPNKNVYYVHQSDLIDMVYQKAAPSLGDIQPWINMTNELKSAKDVLATEEGSASYFPLEDAWKSFQKVEYVLVVRGSYVTPTTGAGDTFVPGHFEGDGQLFSVMDGKHLGGFPLDVASSPQIKVVYSDKSKWSDISSDLMKDLSKRLVQAIDTSLTVATGAKLQ